MVCLHGSPSLRANGKIIYTKPVTQPTTRNQLVVLDPRARLRQRGDVIVTSESRRRRRGKVMTSQTRHDDGAVTSLTTSMVIPSSSSESDSDQDDQRMSPPDLHPHPSQISADESTKEMDENQKENVTLDRDEKALTVEADVEILPRQENGKIAPEITITTADSETMDTPRKSVVNRSVSDNTSNTSQTSADLQVMQNSCPRSKSETSLDVPKPRDSKEPPQSFLNRWSIRKLFHRKSTVSYTEDKRDDKDTVHRNRHSFAGVSKWLHRRSKQDAYHLLSRTQSVDETRSSQNPSPIDETKAFSEGDIVIKRRKENTTKLNAKRQSANASVTWHELSGYQKGDNVEVAITDDDGSRLMRGMSIEHLDRVSLRRPSSRSRSQEKVDRQISRERKAKSLHAKVLPGPDGVPESWTKADSRLGVFPLRRCFSEPCLMSRQTSCAEQDPPKRQWSRDRKNKRLLKGQGRVCFQEPPESPPDVVLSVSSRSSDHSDTSDPKDDLSEDRELGQGQNEMSAGRGERSVESIPCESVPVICAEPAIPRTLDEKEIPNVQGSGQGESKRSTDQGQRTPENVVVMKLPNVTGLPSEGIALASDTRVPIPEHDRDPGPEHTREPGQEHTRDPGQEHTRDPGPEHTRDPGQEHTRDPGQEHTRSPVEDIWIPMESTLDSQTSPEKNPVQPQCQGQTTLTVEPDLETVHSTLATPGGSISPVPAQNTNTWDITWEAIQETTKDAVAKATEAERIVRRYKRRSRSADPFHRVSYRNSTIQSTVDDNGVRETFV